MTKILIDKSRLLFQLQALLLTGELSGAGWDSIRQWIEEQELEREECAHSTEPVDQFVPLDDEKNCKYCVICDRWYKP